ncbi:MAG: orotidine-5'-phosphate decarboxylase [Brevinematia bacterium]
MKTKVILALDVNSSEEAYSLIDELSDYVDCFKVGSILYAECGNTIVEYIRKKNKMVFLDLKFFDIPNTVKGVSYVATKTGVDMFTIHLLGGSEMVKASLDGVCEAIEDFKLNKTPIILGVTILTSLNEDILRNELKVDTSLKSFVLHLARVGYEAGLRGFVCSPQEVRLLKKNLSEDIIVVTPGVRISNDWNDQKRVMTPKMASEEGADYIVVGRSVLNQNDKIDILKKIREEIESF